MSDLLVRGMHGLGDGLHQRALVRHLMQTKTVWLETPFPTIYHDLRGPRLRIINKASALRTQAKNQTRQAALYDRTRPPPGAPTMQVHYRPDDVRSKGSVLAAMLHGAGAGHADPDFRMPVPAEWHAKAEAWISRWKPKRPILFYRPLIERPEWSGCSARNPDYVAYRALVDQVRDRYFLVSVADLVPKTEWMVGVPVIADATCHRGELDFETLAALVARSALAYSSPGFAIVLAQAVGTPSVCVFGGYEDGTSFSLGARLTPHLAIEPIHPCPCFQHHHPCRKQIDLATATTALDRFCNDTAARPAIAA